VEEKANEEVETKEEEDEGKVQVGRKLFCGVVLREH